MSDILIYKSEKPKKHLEQFIESFWMLRNPFETSKDLKILPDGRIDIFFTINNNDSLKINLIGLETQDTQALMPANTTMYVISLKPLAVEYLLNFSIAHLVNSAKNLPTDFLGFTVKDFTDFEIFCKQASIKIQNLLQKKIDVRKAKLFDLIYQSNGEMPVKELSEKSFWSSRQINRYFRTFFGMSLKTYCSILRFRASFRHLKEGNLYPQQNFADQSHFIKEIKKLAGAIPKELSKNQNDRFIQLSTLTMK